MSRVQVHGPGWILLLLLVSFSRDAIAVEPSAREVLHLSATDATAREQLVYAISMNDLESLAGLLDTRELPPVVRGWQRALMALDEGDSERAWDELQSTRSKWAQADPELRLMAGWFDRFQLELALDLGEFDAATRILDAPLVKHNQDAVWWALHARWLLFLGDISNAALRFDRAWALADRAERGDLAFAYRALAHLRAGDPSTAAETWLEYLSALSWARDKAASLRLWDASPELQAAIEVSNQRPKLAEWLARNSRREEALDMCLRAWHEGSEGEAREGYLLAVEQLYRLRRHEELLLLLAERPPRHLDREDEAALAAYPWGVQRRGGSSVEIAQGFDEVVENFAGTDRAVEALWESAWMWELSEGEDEAELRYLRYAEEFRGAPFARAAALRALYLPFRAGEDELVLERFPILRPSLGEGAEQASGLWLAARSAERLGREDEASRWMLELSNLHPDSPFLGSILNPLQAWQSAIDPQLLFERQQVAFEQIALFLGVEGLFDPQQPEFQQAQMLLSWGFFEEGERLLESLARASRRDAETQLRCTALAWSAGRAERQARIAWWLRATLRGADGLSDVDLESCFFPTPYAQAVAGGAERTGVPPGLLWGLMRRESFYEADVISRADAYGLMQLLPKTAQQMSERLGEPQLDDPGLLLDPRFNLRLGGEYLTQLLEESEGNVLQALAAYNAGESNGRRWMARLDENAPAEEFILLISYSETRAYVYHVLRHWELYGRIHPTLAP